MNWKTFLKKVAFGMEKIVNPEFKKSVHKQECYLKHFKEPTNDIERSYFQYKCQMYLYGLIPCLLMNVCALPLFLLLYIKKYKAIESEKDENRATIFLSDGLPDNLLPNSLRREYGSIFRIDDCGFYLDKDDKAFIKELLAEYPFSWLFILKNAIKIGRYSKVISSYKPKRIVVCNEYSFSSSMLTHYCEKRGIRHIDVMHGEKIYTIMDSFFRFHECYVWDEYYSDLFIRLRANENKFVIAIPDSFAISKSETKRVDYTYYLANEDETTMRNIINNMEELSKYNKRVKLRPHPRYTDMRLLYRLHNSIEIEDPAKIGIEESLGQTKNVVSLFSTVLNQASYNQIPVIIDDCSNPQKYQWLCEVDYIGLRKKHVLLSELIH